MKLCKMKVKNFYHVLNKLTDNRFNIKTGYEHDNS